MKISNRQLEAALSLAGLTQAELAELSETGVDPLNKFITGKRTPRDNTLEAWRKVLESNGIEFLDGEGVRLRPKNIEVYEGLERFHEFTEFVYHYLVEHGGHVCVSALDESLFRQYRKDLELYKKRMQELVNRGDVTVRILATKSTWKSNWAEYRYQPAESSTPTAFYAFGNNLALISFAHNPAPYVALHKNSPLAAAYIESFNRQWANAQEPPK